MAQRQLTFHSHGFTQNTIISLITSKRFKIIIVRVLIDWIGSYLHHDLIYPTLKLVFDQLL